MEIDNWVTAGYFSQLYPELRQLGLESNIAELEAFGFTILTPAQVAAPGLHERVLEAVLRVSERRSGVRPDMTAGESHRGMTHPLGQLMRFLLWEDQVFEEALLNPAMLGIVTWLLGPSCTLTLCNAMLRGPGRNAMELHTDECDRSLPLLHAECMTVNATFLLTDYSREAGALTFVPGSHRWRREPTPTEVRAFAKQAVPVEAPAGSFVIWGDQTWHGSLPRKIPGLRGTFFFNFARHTLQTKEPYRVTCTQEALDRRPKRFAVLMDQFGPYPHREEDEDFKRSAERLKYISLFDDQPTNGTVRLRSQLPPRAIPAAALPPKSPYRDGAAPAAVNPAASS